MIIIYYYRYHYCI